MSYELILFDADDTLFDFGRSEVKAFAETLNLYEIGNAEAVYSTYKKISLTLWRELELGKISKDFLKVERFAKTFKQHKISVSPESASKAYLELLPEHVYLIDQALQTCEDLASTKTVSIITNGIKSVQRRRLEKSGLHKHISFTVTSEDCGHAKPNKAFFDYTLTKADKIPLNRILVVGDRLKTDIAGANLYGLDSCWFNPELKEAASIKPKYEIKCLSELKEICR